MDLKGTDKANYIAANDLQATYSLYPGSPASSLISPISRTSGECLSSSFPEREFPPQWDPTVSPQNGKYSRSGSGRLYTHDTTGGSRVSQDTNFFCPATFAQFYLDHNPPFPHTGGRLSVSKDSDVYPNGANGNQNRHTKSPKQDAEELEAYRASFGFSADEIITTPQYVEITDVMDDSFTMMPFASDKPAFEEGLPASVDGRKAQGRESNLLNPKNLKSESDLMNGGIHHELTESSDGCEGNNVLSLHDLENKPRGQSGNVSGACTPGNQVPTDEEDIFSKMRTSRNSRKYHQGLSCSDAEIDYRRGRSLRESKGDFSWHG